MPSRASKRTLFTLIALILSGGGSVPAQTIDTPVSELMQGLQSPGSDVYYQCLRLIYEKQGRGEDVSAAVPALKAYVAQYVDRESPLGVKNRLPQRVLLCLIRMGDAEATQLYLDAEDRNLRRTGRPWIHQNASFLDALQKSDQWDAYSVILRQYSRLKDASDRMKLLYHLARLTEDRPAVVRELNAQVLKGSKFWSPTRGVRVSVFLADQPGVLAPLISKFNQPFADSQLKRSGTGARDEAVLIAAMAPFHDDALALLTRWLADEELADDCDEWFAAYVDSASRLEQAEQDKAWARLRGVAANAYAAETANGPIQYIGYEPLFAGSEEELLQMVRQAFADPDAATLSPSVEELSSGLGTGF